MAGRRRRCTVVVALASASSLMVAGCIGATPRDDFEAEVRARGGGLSNEFVADSLAVIAETVGAPSADELFVVQVRIDPGDRTVALTVRGVRNPDFLDDMIVRDGELASTTPIRDAGDLPLDEITFRLGDVALDRVEEIADAALDAFGDPSAYVDRIVVGLAGDAPRFGVDVESDRRTARAVFDASGSLLEAP